MLTFFSLVLVGLLFSLFLFNSNSLLLSLLIIEIFSFVIVWFISVLFSSSVSSSLVILIFCVFVLESVLGIVGLLNLITFSGSDYVNAALFV